MTSTTETELQRIKAAYRARSSPSHYGFFEPATVLSLQELERQVLALLTRHGFCKLRELRILEVGCGTGYWIREFVKWGAQPEHIVGIDLLADRIAEAKRLCPAGVRLHCSSATHLDYPGGEFDIVVQSTMFTSILDENVKVQIAREMVRVLRPGGRIIWYDFCYDNPRNRNVRGIKRDEVKDLFPGCRVDGKTLTLAPPIARPIARLAPALYHLLSAVTVLRSHYLALIEKTLTDAICD